VLEVRVDGLQLDLRKTPAVVVSSECGVIGTSDGVASTVEMLFDAVLPSQIVKSDAPHPASVRCSIMKRGTDEERYVFGVVLEPDAVDSQGDVYDEEAVKYASRYFMASRHRMGFMHDYVLEDDKYIVVDNYLAPVDFSLEGATVKKGTWLLGVIVTDEELWRQIKAGELNGFSIEGMATVVPV